MEPRLIRRVYLIPIIMGIEMSAGFIICFLIALSRGDVSAYVPFISETGAKPPESGILGIVLVIGSFLGFITMTVRYLIVSELNSGHLKKIDVINTVSLIVGYASLCGMIIVATYPMSTIMTAHMVGAMTTFLAGAAYSFLQTVVTYWLYPTHNGISIFRIRLAISVTCFTFLVLMTIVFPLGMRIWRASHPKADKTPKDKDIIAMKFGQRLWQNDISKIGNKTPQDKGFDEILTSAICEWLMGFSFLFFFFTYVREFQKIFFRLSVNPQVNHFDENINYNQVQDEETRILTI